MMLAQPVDEKELGLVGLPVDVKPDVLEAVSPKKSLPVFYSVARTDKGRA